MRQSFRDMAQQAMAASPPEDINNPAEASPAAARRMTVQEAEEVINEMHERLEKESWDRAEKGEAFLPLQKWSTCNQRSAPRTFGKLTLACWRDPVAPCCPLYDDSRTLTSIAAPTGVLIPHLPVPLGQLMLNANSLSLTDRHD